MENFDTMTEEQKKSFLQKLYNDENKTTEEIAKLIGKTKDSVKHSLRKYDIRKNKLSNHIDPSNPIEQPKLVNTDDICWKETLYKLYVVENKTAQEIADQFGKTKGSIKHFLEKFAISKKIAKQPVTKTDDGLTTPVVKVKKTPTEDENFLLTGLNYKYDDIMGKLSVIINKLDELIEKKN